MPARSPGWTSETISIGPLPNDPSAFHADKQQHLCATLSRPALSAPAKPVRIFRPTMKADSGCNRSTSSWIQFSAFTHG